MKPTQTRGDSEIDEKTSIRVEIKQNQNYVTEGNIYLQLVFSVCTSGQHQGKEIQS